MMPFPPPEIVAPAPIGTIPPCPNAHLDFTHEIRTYAGAGGERRTYNCTCGMTWNQKRPDKLSPGEDPDVRQSNRAALGGAKRRGREYKCRTCGEPKKGHVCTVDLDVNKRAKTFSPSGAALPPMSPMRCEQYDEMLKFSSPPTDAEILAFLRKYDLRPSEATDLYKSMQSYQQALQADTIAVAMTQTAGEPEDTDTAHAMAQAGSARSAEEIEAAIYEHGEPPAPEVQTSEELLLDELISLSESDACADCGDGTVGDDRMTCNCGMTVVHRFCFKLCEHCN